MALTDVNICRESCREQTLIFYLLDFGDMITMTYDQKYGYKPRQPHVSTVYANT